MKARVPMKESPAPTVSTQFVFSVGQNTWRVRLTTQQPFSPSVTTTNLTVQVRVNNE